jgi:hypothetical protein
MALVCHFYARDEYSGIRGGKEQFKEKGRSSPKRGEGAVHEHEGKDIKLYLGMGKRKEQTIAGLVRLDTSI